MMSILGRVPFSGLLKIPRRSTTSLRFLPVNHEYKPKKKFRSYFFDKYVNFVKSYEETLQKNFPSAVKVYQAFRVGLKYFTDDTMILFRGYKKANSEGWGSLSRKELEVYWQLPKDMLRTAPVLIVAAGVPFGGFVMVVAYYFPRQLLTYHFWSLQQRSEFSLFFHKKKLQHFKPLYKCMQQKLAFLKDHPLYSQMKEVLDCIENGIHPSPNLILTCKPLFEIFPFGLEFLSRNHTLVLLRMYDMHKGWRRRTRLEFKASLIHLMDAAIIKEGGLEKLTQDEIKWNCFLRGLNPINMKQEDIHKWMETWLSISQKIDKSSYSLLLHCPVLLGYNQPSNWGLLRDER